MSDEQAPSGTTPPRPQRAMAIIVALVGALLIGGWLQPMLPDSDEVATAPYVRAGVLGESVDYRLGTVSVTDVQGAKEYVNYGRVAATSGIWLVFDLEFVAKDEPRSIPAPYLRDAEGRLYGGSQAVTNLCGPAQPGMIAECRLALEVPESALEGSTLILPASFRMLGAPDDEVAIDLMIDAAKAKEIVADAGRVDHKETTFKGQA